MKNKKAGINKDNFFTVSGWMIIDLDLKGNELMLFAIIYGFSQAPGNTYSGSLSYLQSFCGASRTTVITSLNSLVSKGFIIRNDNIVNGNIAPEYIVNNKIFSDNPVQIPYPVQIPNPVQITNPPRTETVPNPVQIPYQPRTDSVPNIEYIDNKDKEDINKESVYVDDEIIKSIRIENIDSIKNLKKFTTSIFKKILIQLGADRSHVEDWTKVRTSKKASFTQTSILSFLNECKKNNFPVADAVKICAERDWKGFKFEWLKSDSEKEKNSAQKEKPSKFETNANAFAKAYHNNQ